MSTHKKIICLDFDGVVHSYTSGWRGARTIPDPPVPGALSWMLNALNSGHRVAIYSSRSGHWFGRWAMRRWLRKHSTPDTWLDSIAAGLEMVEFPKYKPAAHVSIDDRAITFKGTWPDLRTVEDFMPWNKEGAKR